MNSTWGIYWSELASGVKQDGTPFYSPDIADIDHEIISYWMSRSEACKHPVMQARYADLSWEIGRYLRTKSKHEGKTGSTISITFYQRAIDAYLQCVEKDLFKSDYDAWIYISRALELSLSMKDRVRTEKSKASLFAFASKQEKEKADWMWWQFENIVWSNSKALGLDDKTRNEVISLLNRVLAKRSNHSDKEHFNPHEATSAADSLCRWLAQTNNIEDSKKVIKIAALAFEEAAKQAGGITAIAWLEDLIPKYRQFGMLEDAARIERTIAQRAKDAQAEMGVFETSYELKKEEVEQWTSQFIAEDANKSLIIMARRFIVREKETKDRLQKIGVEAPLFSMLPSSIMNSEGFTVASVGSIEEDIDGRAIQHAATILAQQSPWLNLALEKIKEQFSLDVNALMELIKTSPLFPFRHHQLVREGVEAWLAKDSIKAIHILVPQVESALRELLKILGGAVMIPDADIGGFKAIGLGQVLNHSFFKEKIPTDIRFHFRVLYNDPRGLNVRNELAHGLISPELLDIELANWILHSVIFLSLIRVDNNTTKPS